MGKELLFSVTARDCRWDYIRGSGKGGQKRNKTSSKVRCTHVASGAVAESDDTRSQHKNKGIAFKRMSETREFQAWHKIECARVTGKIRDAEEAVEIAMRPKNLCVEGKQDGKWVPLADQKETDAPLTESRERR